MHEGTALEPGDFAVLRVADLTKVGAFLAVAESRPEERKKDLLLPFAEQTKTLRVGDDVLVYLYLDNTQRLCASMRVERNVDTSFPDYQIGDAVDLIIAMKTDLGFKAIVDGRYIGLLYADEIYQPLSYAQKLNGFIKKVRDDGKIDLQLSDPLNIGHKSADPIADLILEKLQSQDGFLPITDKTPAEDIYEWFGVSKKKFKIALGGLYKKRVLTVEPDGIRLVKKGP